MNFVRHLICVFVILLIFLPRNLLSDENIHHLISLHGKEYEEARNKIIKNGKLILPKNAQLDTLLLLEILQARKQHPDLFKKLPKEVIQPAYKMYEEQMKVFSNCPYKIIKGRVATFMRQGGIIEEEEGVISISLTGNFADLNEIKRPLQKEWLGKIKKIKEINKTACLAAIEYLWKLSKHWRVEYELLDLFYEKNNSGRFNKRLLPVSMDIFERSNHPLILELCAKIFLKENYKKPLLLAREKLNNAYENNRYNLPYSFVIYINKFGNDNDKKILRKIKRLQEEKRKKYQKATRNKASLLEIKSKEKKTEKTPEDQDDNFDNIFLQE